jgi:nucleoid-associated protein YgaU
MSTPTPGQKYTIQSGDTLFSIATAAYGAANANAGVTAIENANSGIDPGNLQVGAQISIPALPAPAPPRPGQEYTIQSGDTLFSIATAAYGAANASAGVTAIMEANGPGPGPALEPGHLTIGTQIDIPAQP